MNEEKKAPLFMRAVNISKTYRSGSVFRKKSHEVKALRKVSVNLYAGRTLGLVGESGCGKSTLGKCLLRAIEPTEGQIFLSRTREEGYDDFLKMNPKQVLANRARMQMVFQDPYTSLDPNMTVKDLIAEPLLFHGDHNAKQQEEAVKNLMEAVGLDPRYMGRYPHAFSGGQRQRICIARAIATNPEFVVCDEAVSALDVSVRAQIINLLMDLQEERHMAYLFISHDLTVVRYISHDIAVLYAGQIVEQAPSEELFAHPAHPYTQLLLKSVPHLDPHRRFDDEPAATEGEVGESAEEGCPFYSRCVYHKAICRQEALKLKEITSNHLCACRLVQEGQ